MISYEDAITKRIVVPSISYLSTASIFSKVFMILAGILVLFFLNSEAESTKVINYFQENLQQINFLSYRYHEMVVMYRGVEKGILSGYYLSGLLSNTSTEELAFYSRLRLDNISEYLSTQTSSFKSELRKRFDIIERREQVPRVYYEQLNDKKLDLASPNLDSNADSKVSMALGPAMTMLLQSYLPEISSPITPSLFLSNFLSSLAPVMNENLMSLDQNKASSTSRITTLLVCAAVVATGALTVSIIFYLRSLRQLRGVLLTVSDIHHADYDTRITSLRAVTAQMENLKAKASLITRMVCDNLNGDLVATRNKNVHSSKHTRSEKFTTEHTETIQQGTGKLGRSGFTSFDKPVFTQELQPLHTGVQMPGVPFSVQKVKRKDHDKQFRFDGNSTRKETFYFFRTGLVFLLICLFFSMQFIFCGVVLGVFYNFNSSRELIDEQNKTLLSLAVQLMDYRNSFFYLGLVGNHTQLEQTFLQKYGRIEIGNSSVMQNQIRNISEHAINLQSKITDPASSLIVGNYTSILFSTLCNSQISISGVTPPPAYVCQQLDSQLPSKGLVQALSRAKALLDGTYNWLVDTNPDKQMPLQPGSMLSFQILTAPSITRCLSLLSQLSITAANDRSSTLTLMIWSFVSATICLGLLLLCVGVGNLLGQAHSVAFVFRLVPISGVMNRQRVRNQVARLFGLDRRDFGEGRV